MLMDPQRKIRQKQEQQQLDHHFPPPSKQIQIRSITNLKMTEPHNAQCKRVYSARINDYVKVVKTQIDRWMDNDVFDIIKINNVWIGTKSTVTKSNGLIMEIGLFNIGYLSAGQCIWFTLQEANTLIFVLIELLKRIKLSLKTNDFYEILERIEYEDIDNYKEGKVISFDPINLFTAGHPLDSMLQATTALKPSPENTAANILSQSMIRSNFLIWFRTPSYDILRYPKVHHDQKSATSQLFTLNYSSNLKIFAANHADSKGMPKQWLFSVKKKMGVSDFQMIHFSPHEAQHMVFQIHRLIEAGIVKHLAHQNM